MGLGGVIALFFEALWLLVLVYVLGSWFPGARRNSWYRTIEGIIEPMLRPFRRIIPPNALGGLDLSPFFLMLALTVVQRLLAQVLGG